jgi:hypothetical protein
MRDPWMPFEPEFSQNKEGLNYVVLKSKRPYLHHRNVTIVHFRPMVSKEPPLYVMHVEDADVEMDHAM